MNKDNGGGQLRQGHTRHRKPRLERNSSFPEEETFELGEAR